MKNYTKDDIRKICKEEDVHYIRMQFTDIMGIVKNVEIPITRLEDALDNNVMFDGSSIEGFVRIYEADMFLHPDLNTFLVLNWEDNSYGKVARFICDVYRPGKNGKHVPFEGDPRGILKKNLARMNEMGFKAFNVGLEPEFFLFKLDANGKPTLEFNDNGGYFDLSPIDCAEDCRRDIVAELQRIGFVVEAAHHEVSMSQHEINFRFDNALEACDNVQTFKIVVKNVAKRHGLHATFMPKPIYGINGSGMHSNCSLVKDDGKNAFYDENSANGLSELCRKWISGILDHARGFCLITNISWSDSNRSTMVRIPAARGLKTRTEVRSVDVTANPYLAMSAILAAGLDGISGNCKDYAPVYDNLFAMTDEERAEIGVYSLPADLNEAIKCFLKDQVIMKAMGDHVCEKLVQAKQLEWDNYRRQVTKWEIDNYIMRY